MSAKVLRRTAPVDDGAGLERGWAGRRSTRSATHCWTTRPRMSLCSRRTGCGRLRIMCATRRTGSAGATRAADRAELARCILLDHFDLPGDTDTDWDSRRLPVSYQRFKFDVIARLDQHQPWSITARADRRSGPISSDSTKPGRRRERPTRTGFGR